MGFFEFIKLIDIFGIHIHFYIKSRKKYTTLFSELIFLLFIILSSIYLIINLVPFIQRINVSVIHYSKKIFKTDKIVFNDETSSFAIGLDCDLHNGSYGKLEDLFDVQFNYITRVKINRTSVKNK